MGIIVYKDMDDMNDNDDAVEERSTKSMSVKEVRYSYRAMMEEVEKERRYSTVGRELIDAVEIGQIFDNRRRRIKKS